MEKCKSFSQIETGIVEVKFGVWRFKVNTLYWLTGRFIFYWFAGKFVKPIPLCFAFINKIDMS